MKHQLDPGSYELWQGGELRAHGYVEQTGPDTTLQRWLFLKDYVLAPKVETTFNKASAGFRSLGEWEQFVQAGFGPGCKYGRAIAERYGTISVTPRPEHQLDGNSRIYIAHEMVGDVFVERIAGATTQYVEHWVLLPGFESSGERGFVARDGDGYASLDIFQAIWKERWGDNFTYVVATCSYFNALPDSL